MKLSILGIGSVSALGCGCESLEAALSGSRQPRIEPVAVHTESGQIDLPVYWAVAEGLERFVPRRALRRLDSFTRMALLSSFLALEDAGLIIEDKTRIGVVFGTGHGPLKTTFQYQDKIIDDGDAGASPTLFANSVHNALASQVSIFTGIEGPCLTITSFELTATEVLTTAAAWLQRGTVDHVLLGVGDEYCAALGYAICRLRDGGTNRIDPLDFDRCSYLPGEGFVAFVLGNVPPAKRVYGHIHRIVSQRSFARPHAELLAGHRAIFLAANGDQRSGTSYKQLDLSGVEVAAYSPLYGSMPVGLGFDLAFAAISCRAGRLYPSAPGRIASALNPLTQGADLGEGEEIGCLDCSPHHATLVSVGKG